MPTPAAAPVARVVASLSLLALLLAAPAAPALADALDREPIGSSSFSGEAYACVTYPGGEDIEVTKRNGKLGIMDKDVAERRVERDLRKASGALIRAQNRVEEKQQKLDKLLVSPKRFLDPWYRKIENLREEIPALDERITLLTGQRDELEQLLGAVAACGEGVPTLNGSNVLQIGTTDLPMSGYKGYLISALHVFLMPPGTPDRVCASFNGSEPLEVGIRHSACVEYNDGPGTLDPVSACYDSAIPEDAGAIGLGSRAGYFHLGDYQDHLDEVSELLATQVDLFVPTAQRSCPR